MLFIACRKLRKGKTSRKKSRTRRREKSRNSATPQPHHRLLWEIDRIRAILLRAHEQEILVRDDRFLSRDLKLMKMENALRAGLDKGPVIEEGREERDREHLRRDGIDL